MTREQALAMIRSCKTVNQWNDALELIKAELGDSKANPGLWQEIKVLGGNAGSLKQITPGGYEAMLETCRLVNEFHRGDTIYHQ